MLSLRRRPLAYALWAFASLCAVVWLTYHGVHTTALQTAAQQAAATVQLQARDLRSSVEKFEHLPSLVGAERTLSDLLRTPENRVLVDQANRYLAFAKARTDVAAVYLIDLHGRTLAASNWESATSYVGQNYRFRPYFQAAIQGRTSMFYGIGVTTGTPGAFIAAPLYLGQHIAGVVAVKIDLTAFETRWREAGLHIAMADAQGIVFLTTQPDWRYRSLRPLPPPGAGTSARHTAIWRHCAAHPRQQDRHAGRWRLADTDHRPRDLSGANPGHGAF